MRKQQIEWWQSQMAENFEKQRGEEFFWFNPEITNSLFWEKLSTDLGFADIDSPHRIGGDLDDVAYMAICITGVKCIGVCKINSL